MRGAELNPRPKRWGPKHVRLTGLSGIQVAVGLECLTLLQRPFKVEALLKRVCDLLEAPITAIARRRDLLIGRKGRDLAAAAR